MWSEACLEVFGFTDIFSGTKVFWKRVKALAREVTARLGGHSRRERNFLNANRLIFANLIILFTLSAIMTCTFSLQAAVVTRPCFYYTFVIQFLSNYNS